MEIKGYWSRHQDQALEYAGIAGPVVQRRDMDDEGGIEPEITRVRDDCTTLYSRGHSQRPTKEHRHQVGARCDKGCGEPYTCQGTLIFRTCRSHAALTHPKHHDVRKGTGKKSCWKTKEKVA